MNIPDHISESLKTIFRLKIIKFFEIRNLLDPGSGMEKIRIREKHRASATLDKSRCFTVYTGVSHPFQPGIAGALGREAQQPRSGGKEAPRFGHFYLIKTHQTLISCQIGPVAGIWYCNKNFNH